MKMKRRDERRIREEAASIKDHYGNETLRQDEGGGIIATKNTPLFDMSEIYFLFMNHRKTRENLEEMVPFKQKMSPLLV